MLLHVVINQNQKSKIKFFFMDSWCKKKSDVTVKNRFQASLQVVTVAIKPGRCPVDNTYTDATVYHSTCISPVTVTTYVQEVA